MYCRKAKLRLPLKSILEEYKCGKARLLSMLEDSEDPVAKTVQPTIKTGPGSSTAKWWSKAEGKEKRDMVINEIRINEDSRRVQKAVQQPQQGQWTNWDNALQKSITWNEIWHMAPLRISFLIRSVYDLLPSNANLGRYTWRHNRVLQELAAIISTAKGETTLPNTNALIFTTEGGAKSWHERPVRTTNQIKCLLDGCDDWDVSADLPEWDSHPSIIKATRLRPNIVIHSASTQLIMVELTVPYENRMEEAHIYKREKYMNLTKELENAGYKAVVMPVEVCARGFVGSSVYDLLTKHSICGNKRTKALKLLAEIAENSSRWIWSRRNERFLHKD
ncbi:hypothetical protein RRG08_063042 [Elysia crispata]|uniref:Uncharacterized protein n=1 Tax=Elysia crispata TaxID=231223 RepID=A0AAE1DZM2_9GAST|nr:hypothetical protein RRG08_063042 [Elysia crispata]